MGAHINILTTSIYILTLNKKHSNTKDVGIYTDSGELVVIEWRKVAPTM